ncbi:hypothetical protein [Sphingosinithalassobacter portus]|uniref:hypothetical protein n=1 Tax=Stakelama portus TaxID=2676234 RepID=UPI000C57F0F2|nr:hypothetical protein [Sphingosinithalassobacter portus]MBA15923.1 hypothetical protein [Sphingomonas sp.]|tara:strand:- start:69 stop:287 length:219 start_codon:yes stop_codon:yes gene_type:complete
MGATTTGAVIGGAIDAMSGDDGITDGAMKGAIIANVLKFTLPVVVTAAVGYAAYRGAKSLWYDVASSPRQHA